MNAGPARVGVGPAVSCGVVRAACGIVRAARLAQFPLRSGRQLKQAEPDFAQVQFTHLPLPLHRQQIGIFSLLSLTLTLCFFLLSIVLYCTILFVYYY